MTQENVIEVVIKAVDQMSADLKKVEGELAHLAGTTQRTEQTTARLAGSNRALVSTLGPMRGALGQVTTMLAQMNPQAAILISSMDNLALSLASAGLRFGSLAMILKTVGITAVIIGITAAIGQLVSGWQTATKAQEDFKKSLDELGVQRAGFGASSVLGGITAQAYERARQISELLAKNKRAQESSILAPIPGAARFTGTLTLEQQLALQNELALMTPKLAASMGAMVDAIEKQSRARRDGVAVLQEELRVLEAQISMTQGVGDPVKSAKAAADMKELELNLLRQLGPEQQAYIDQVVRSARADRAATDALQLKNEQLNFFLEALRKQQAETFKVAPGEPGAGDEMTIQEELVQMSAVVRNAETNLNRESLAMATSMADSFSRTFTDRLVMFMSGGGQVTIQQLAADIGKSLVTMLIQTIIKELLISPLQQILIQWVRGGSGQLSEFSPFGAISGAAGAGSLFGGLFGGGGPEQLSGPPPEGGFWSSILSFFSSIGGFFGFAHGGMVIPPGALHKFQHGGQVRNGPVMGVLGEEGPEIVARMKPMRSGDDVGGDLHQNIYLVDQRPPRLGRNDVLLIIHDDMERGGRTAKGVENVVRRGGHGR